MIRYALLGALLGLSITPQAPAQHKPAGATTANRIEIRRLATGATVGFVRTGSGDWGLEIAVGGGARTVQPKPAQIEVFRGGDHVSQLAAGYQTVQKAQGGKLALKLEPKSVTVISIEQ